MSKNYIGLKEEGLINPEDAQFFEEFFGRYATINKLSKSSRDKYVLVAKHFLPWIRDQGKTLRTLDEQTVLRLIAWLQESPWSEDTRESFWDRFTRIYEHIANKHGFDKHEGYKLLAGGLKERYRYKIDKDNVEKKHVFTPEEILKIVYFEPELCYKVFFAVLYESGMRSGEMLSLNIEHVDEHKSGGYTLRMQKSKSIIRPVPLVEFGV